MLYQIAGRRSGASGLVLGLESVPDGLAGERLDAAMARVFGFSRTRAAQIDVVHE